jgi:hypothetical protein
MAAGFLGPKPAPVYGLSWHACVVVPLSKARTNLRPLRRHSGK